MSELGWINELSLDRIFDIMRFNGVTEIIYKNLASNDNSKNQVYLAGDFSQLSKIPSGDIVAHASVTEKGGGHPAIFRAPLNFWWINDYGEITPAPNAKLIYYPQYPEVRLSGFLLGCSDAPSELFDIRKRGRDAGRILMLGVGAKERVIAIALPQESRAAKELSGVPSIQEYGALRLFELDGSAPDDPAVFLAELCRIHAMGFVDSIRLNSFGEVVPCNASNCNGNTLEALLGIRSNGIALPDFMGWEVKARTVSNLEKPGVSVVTLFTPEPNSGEYQTLGVADFLRKYGYTDSKQADRLNFGGIYKVGANAHSKTGLKLVLSGYDAASPKSFAPNGGVELVTPSGVLAMRWSFTKLLDHWKKKHAKAAYVPCVNGTGSTRTYRFGSSVLLGTGADFTRFLAAIAKGDVYYDPGIKLESASTPGAKSKRRSQFRVSSKNIPSLYEKSAIVDVCSQNKDDDFWLP